MLLRLINYILLLAGIFNSALAQDAVKWVDPFIGTSNKGNTFPGVVLPWGMVSVSPHNTTRGPTSYVSGNPFIYGFGHLQLSGVGCPEVGSVVIRPLTGSLEFDAEKGKSAYSREESFPGYYSVYLSGPRVTAKMSATMRSGRLSFSYPSGRNYAVIDLGFTQSHVKGGQIRRISDNEFEGYKDEGNFCDSGLRRRTYFFIRVRGSIIKSGLFRDNAPTDSSRVTDRKCGAYVVIDNENQSELEFSTGISSVSIANAKLNLEVEQKGNPSLREMVDSAREAWNKQLNKIKVKGGSSDDFRKFYTALYHTLIHPSIYTDVNNEYLTSQTEDQQERFVRKSPFPRYSVYSLWDTYRTVHPLLSLFYPREQQDMVTSLVEIGREGKWLPKWELYGQESWVMVGDPAAIVIADSYIKGLTAFDTATAFALMYKGATQISPMNYVRPGLEQYAQNKFIPIDRRGGEDSTTFKWNNGYVWGTVSTSLEYYLADWAIGQFASRIGKPREFEFFNDRANGFVHQFDTATNFFRPRNANGSWKRNFNPEDRFYDIRWQKSGGHGFVEGTAWTYRFFVPHNVQGLISLYGSEKEFRKQLVAHFENGHFDISNEPDISYPFLFNYIKGSEYMSTRYAHRIIDTSFGTGPSGIPGNDDSGTMSAWLVFAMLGIYPDCPGSSTYQLTIPKFKSYTFDYNGRGVSVSVKGKGNSVAGLTIDGRFVPGVAVDHFDLIGAEKIVFNIQSQAANEE